MDLTLHWWLTKQGVEISVKTNLKGWDLCHLWFYVNFDQGYLDVLFVEGFCDITSPVFIYNFVTKAD
jgi:hypothetical protein